MGYHQARARFRTPPAPDGAMRELPAILQVESLAREEMRMPNVEKRERLKLPHVPTPKRPPQERVQDFCEVTLTYSPEQAIAEASRCVECAKPPCEKACPLRNPIKEWLGLTARGKILEAPHLLRATRNMPAVCGRICPQG